MTGAVVRLALARARRRVAERDADVARQEAAVVEAYRRRDYLAAAAARERLHALEDALAAARDLLEAERWLRGG